NETHLYRASIALTPSPSFDLLLRAEQGFQDGDGPAGQKHAQFSRDSFDLALDHRGYAIADWEQASLEANWRVGFGDGTIPALAGWRRVGAPWSADIVSTGAFVFHSRVVNAHEQSSQGLRYAGGFGVFDLTAGLYRLEQDLVY